MFGFLINWFDWPAIYHVTGVIGVVWFITWWFMVYDSPEQHPHISEKEKTYIQNKLGNTITERKTRVRAPFFLCTVHLLQLLRRGKVFFMHSHHSMDV
jgi:Na+/melibiose symporter-like transporter